MSENESGGVWAGDDPAERLSLIGDTCRDLIARIDRREYNYGPEHVRSDLAYLLACATPPAETGDQP